MERIEIGVLVGLTAEPRQELLRVKDLGLSACQLCCWDAGLYTDRVGEMLDRARGELGVRVATLWAGWPGPCVWNFTEGPATIGLVPRPHRAERVAILKRAADFAADHALPSITTHCGFIPEDPADPLFDELLDAVSQIATHCRARGVEFWFETGQETPVTLLRTIERVGADNLGINLDPANLILYGKANPVDALDVFGRYVRGVHAKDGLYPTDGTHLGTEVPLGEGKVNFPLLVPKLKALGFGGVLAIEREISGPQQTADVRKAIELLTPLC